MSLDLQQVFDFAIQLSFRAGKAITEGSETRFKNAAGFDEKKNTADLVTETDQNTEKLVRDAIQAKYPDHEFIGEESWAAGDEGALTDAPTWIIDPIDGTTNFVKGMPHVCISIGFVYNSVPTIGVIYAPFMGQLFAGRKGHGAFMTSSMHPERHALPLAKPLPFVSLKQALVAFEWGSDRSNTVMEKKSRTFKRLAGDSANGVDGGEMVLGVRSMGSAALNFAHVACGSLDSYWEIGCWAWDVCAGIVIAGEAGCAVVGSKEQARGAVQSGEWPPAVTPAVLTGRKYLVVRGMDSTPKEPSADAQKRYIRTFYNAVDEWDP